MEFLNMLGTTVVFLSGLYLVGLASIAFARPDLARRFLEGFASTRSLHLIELFIRHLVGVSFVLYAPKMGVPGVFNVFGWVLVCTTIVLAFVPWKLHRRFSEWSVPLATRSMILLGFGSYIAGIFILLSLFYRPSAIA